MLNIGQMRTRGAWKNTGTETKKTAIAKGSHRRLSRTFLIKATPGSFWGQVG
jgi:hypothetical protein